MIKIVGELLVFYDRFALISACTRSSPSKFGVTNCRITMKTEAAKKRF